MIHRRIVQIPARSRRYRSPKDPWKVPVNEALDRRATRRHDRDVILDARQRIPQTPVRVGKAPVPEVDEEFDPDDSYHWDDPADREDEDHG